MNMNEAPANAESEFQLEGPASLKNSGFKVPVEISHPTC
jgi:hypothetical protein